MKSAPGVPSWVALPPSAASAVSASSSVDTPTIFRSLPLAASCASAISDVGTRNTLAPVRITAMVFCFSPPIGPTAPPGLIVPVAATSTPPVRSPGVSVSSSASVNARPADGPPIWPESMSTLNGNWNVIVSGGEGFGTKPMMARPSIDAISCVGCRHRLVARA